MIPSRLLVPILIALTSSVCGAATDIFLPALPSIMADLKTTIHTSQLAIPCFLAGSALGAPFFGPLSDSYGRRPILLLGLSIFVIGSLMCAVSINPSMLLLGRFLQGCGSIVSSVVGWALIHDLYPGEKSARVMSVMSLGISAMPVIAPVLGGYLTVTLGWRMIFILTALAGAGLLVSLANKLKSVPDMAPRHMFSLATSIKTYKAMFTNRSFLAYIMLFPLLLTIEWCWLTIAPFYFINHVGLHPDRFGMWLTVAGFGWVTGALATSFLLTRLGLMRTIQVGLTLAVIGCILHLIFCIVVPFSPAALLGAFALANFGSAFVYSPSSAKAFQFFDHARGAASAVRSTIIMMTCSAGGLVASYLGTASLLPLSLFMLCLGGLAVSLCAWIRKHHDIISG